MRAPGAPPTPPLPPVLGRDAQLAVISGHLRRLAAGRGGAVLVEGAAGSGRTRLLAEASSLASSLGFAVAAAVADELTAAAPLGTLTEALRGGVRPIDLATELEALAAAAGRRAVVDRLGELLVTRAGRRPLVVSIDDLQWADSLTLLAVRTLPARLTGHPVLWMVARRLLAGDAAVRAAFEHLAAAGADRLLLEPLDRDAVRALARALAGGEPDADLAAHVEDAAGSPAYVVQLLHGLAAEDRLAAAGGEVAMRGDHLPWRLRATVMAHLRPLSPEATQLLQVGSVLGPRFAAGHATALLGRRPAEVAPWVAEAVAARILDEAGETLAFRQELVRRVVSDLLSESVKQALHRDAGRLLMAEGAGAAAAVRHFTIDAAPDEETIDVLWQAARETAQAAPGAASDLALRALRQLRPRDPRRADLLAFVVPLLGSAGRLDEIEHLAGGALDAGLAASSEAAIRLGLAVGMAHAGRTAAAGEHVRRGLESEGWRGGLAAGLLALRSGLLVRPDLRGAAELAATAEREGHAAACAGAVVGARTVLAGVALHRGELSGALALAAGAAELARGADVTAGLSHPNRMLALCLIALGRYDEALAAVAECRREGRSLGSDWFLASSGNLEALAHLGAGRLDGARTAATAALVLARGRGIEPVERLAQSVLAEVAVRQGDLARARIHVDRAVPLADDPWGLADTAWPLAWLVGAEGQLAAALEVLDAAFAGLRRGRFGIAALDPSRLPLLVRLALLCGDRARAEVAAAAARELAARNPDVAGVAGSAAHAEGLVRSDAARLAAAVELLRAGGRPIALGEALEDLGRTLADRGGDRDRAVAALEEAQGCLAAAGAERDAARVRRVLRVLGTRRRYAAARVRPVTGWDSLTEAERRAARLAADGLTNLTIARRLFVSPNTVATQLRHVYAKLGVRSRVDLTRIVLQQDGDDGPA